MLTSIVKAKYFILATIFLLQANIYLKSEDLAIEIDNPRFSEKGLNDKVYEIKAKKGLKFENKLELFEVEGKFKTEKNGKWIYLVADTGSFIQITNFIELHKNIIFYTEEGEIVKSNHASFDMNDDVIKLRENVSHESSKGLILSDDSIITDNFNKIKYSGNVVSILKSSN